MVKPNRVCGWLLGCAVLLVSAGALGAVGRTEGGASVTATGAASYSIPLQLPPGTNGLSPSLALNYSHTGSNGLLGMGWSISGLSSISRCHRTVAQDGAVGMANLSASDGYCLDGSRLRLTSGTYGTAGSTYQTEIETFSKATAFGSAGAGVASWEVRTKDGLIYEYGNTTDSRIETVGSATVRQWALNRIRDRSGNYIDVLYSEDTANGSFRPAEIRYTGNPLASPAPGSRGNLILRPPSGDTCIVGQPDRPSRCLH